MSNAGAHNAICAFQILARRGIFYSVHSARALKRGALRMEVLREWKCYVHGENTWTHRHKGDICLLICGSRVMGLYESKQRFAIKILFPLKERRKGYATWNYSPITSHEEL